MSKEDDVLPWWRGRLKGNQLMSAFFSKTWNKLGNRVAAMFPDHYRDLYYTAGRLAGLEAQKEYFKIGKKKPPSNIKEVVGVIETTLERLIVPFGDVKISKVRKMWQDEEATIEIKDNPYAVGLESEKPSCFFLKGFIEAVFEYLTAFETDEYEKLAVNEEACMSAGAESCKFKITRVSSRWLG
ncbi:MAG: V4R domain-containing protein [Candidatus Thorarchaeota archaeon]